MKNLFFLIFLMFSLFSYSQTRWGAVVEASTEYMYYDSYDQRSKMITGTSLGILLDFDKSSLNINVNYGFGHYLEATNLMFSHMLGGSVNYYIFKNSSRFTPFLEVEFLKELSKKNINAFLDPDYLNPIKHPYREGLYSSPNPPVGEWVNYARLYQSLWHFNVNLGVAFQVINNLEVKLSTGYSLQSMGTKYYMWKNIYGFDQNKVDKLPIEKFYFHMFDVRLGMAYSIPFKKNNN